MESLYYIFCFLFLLTIVLFVHYYVHQLIYEDNAYVKPFNFIGFLWAVFFFVFFLANEGYL